MYRQDGVQGLYGDCQERAGRIEPALAISMVVKPCNAFTGRQAAFVAS